MAEENGPGIVDAVGQFVWVGGLELQVLGGDFIGEFYRIIEAGYNHDGPELS